jgi:hypothetical protein
MAKSVRGSSSRPGQRRPIQRTTPRPAPTAGSAAGSPQPNDSEPSETALGAYEGGSLTDADLARAAALEAQIVAEEKAAEASRQPKSRVAATPRAGGTLTASAAEEYAYVARDVRRIALIGGSLVALLVGGWAVIQVTGIGLF